SREEILAHEGAFDQVVGILSRCPCSRAARAKVGPERCFRSPPFRQPIRAVQGDAAQVRALQQGWASLHVVVGHANRKIEAVAVVDSRQRIDGNISSIPRRLSRRLIGASARRRRRALARTALSLRAGSGAPAKNGEGSKSGEKPYLEAHHHQLTRRTRGETMRLEGAKIGLGRAGSF